jgi:hypothetical protein
MSEKPVEIVRRHIAAFQERDVAAASSFLDPHIVMDWTRTGGIESPVIYGLDALQDFARGKTSGVPVNRSTAVLYTVIGGKIARITQFPTEQQAFRSRTSIK